MLYWALVGWTGLDMLKEDANCEGKLTIASRELQYCPAHIGPSYQGNLTACVAEMNG